ncbi:MAG TPA: HlyD family efflux transporter periplasmic adaptor subunit [Bacteroidales bacterium]|nr:HlyD family efflux transporter periplasmic adaptor subunit [Bacteroidales bacterium]
MLQNPIFREKAFQRLTSPEKLDELLQVTSARSWLILIALILMIVIFIVWAFTGTITSSASGPGLFNRPREQIVALYPGWIDTIYVYPGSHVKAGQMLAEITPEDLLLPIARLQSELSVIRQQDSTDQNPYVRDIERQLKELTELADTRSGIVSPSNGTIAEVKIIPGTVIPPGEVLFSLQKWTNDTHPSVIFLLPEPEIKEVKTGMDVQIIMDDDRDRTRFAGKIDFVSGFPVSRERISNLFQDEQMVDRLAQSTHYEVSALIDWSAGLTAEDVNRNNGKICQVTTTISKKRPIHLLFNK